MSIEVLIGDGEAARLVPHPLRAAILGEVQARPFTLTTVSPRVLHFAFDTSNARAKADPEADEEIVEQRLQAIGAHKVGGLAIWSPFLARRPKIVTATLVPVVAFSIWWTVRRIRRKHIGG